MFRTRWIPHVFACLLLLVPSAPILCAPADSPQREKKEMEEAVAKLGSADPAEREAATRSLGILGGPGQGGVKRGGAGGAERGPGWGRHRGGAAGERDPAVAALRHPPRHACHHHRPARTIPTG